MRRDGRLTRAQTITCKVRFRRRQMQKRCRADCGCCRLRLPGKPARTCRLRMSKLDHRARTRCALRFTTRVSAIPVRLTPLSPAAVLVSGRMRPWRHWRVETNSVRCLHTLRKGPRGCIPHCPRARGRWNRRVRRRGRHKREAWRPRCCSLVRPPSRTAPRPRLTPLKHTRMQGMQVLQVRQDQPLRQDPRHTRKGRHARRHLALQVQG
jgi:hypothetical protein